MNCLLLTIALAQGLAETDSATEFHGCHSVPFPTRNVHRGYMPLGGSQLAKDVFERSLRALPESVLVQSVVAGGEGVGLSADQQNQLLPMFSEKYAEIAADTQMSKLSSALPYCLSTTVPTDGHYFLYVPRELTQQTAAIVFLHGFGGNFQFYLKVLKDEFPDHIIVLPSWGSTWATGNAKYIREVYDDINRRFSIAIPRARLMSISGGGPISFEIYDRNAMWFTDLVVLASMPRPSTIPNLRTDLSVLMINGTKDKRFPIKSVRQVATQLKGRVPSARFIEVPADHFFFLSQIDKWSSVVRGPVGVK